MAKADIELKIQTKGAEQASAKLNKLGVTSDRVAMGLKAGLVAGAFALAKGISESIQAFADFDDKMAQSLAIMQTTTDQQESMKQKAMEVSRATRISASDSAEAYFFLASAGLDAEQSIAALPQVAKFAQAGMFDMATATDLATDAQSALGLTVKDAQKNLDNLTRVTDVLVKANTLANASVQQFSEALTTKSGAALKVVNKDIEEGVAVLAAFADRGVKGAEAGDKLNQVLRDIPRATAKNSAEFEKLGLNMFDTEGNMKNVADIIEELDAVLGPMSDEMKAATLDQLGLNRGVADAVKILSGAGNQIREYEKELRNASGTTEEIAENQMKSLNAQTDLMKNAFAELGIAIGQRMEPALLSVVGGLTTLARKFVDVINLAEENEAAVEGNQKAIKNYVGGMESWDYAAQRYGITQQQITVDVKDYRSATDKAIQGDEYRLTTTDIINQAIRDKSKVEKENTEVMDEVVEAQEEVVHSFEDGISAIQDAVGAYRKLKNMQEDVADAEKRRDKANEKLTKEQDKRLDIVEDIEEAEKELLRQQEKSIEVTKEERLGILRQEEAIRKLEEAEDKSEIQKLELALAKEKLLELQQASVGATYEEEQALRSLQSLQDDLVRQDERILDAKERLTEAQDDLNSAMEQTPDKMLDIFLATEMLNEAMKALGGEGGPLMEATMSKIAEIMGPEFAENMRKALGSLGQDIPQNLIIPEVKDNTGQGADFTKPPDKAVEDAVQKVVDFSPDIIEHRQRVESKYMLPELSIHLNMDGFEETVTKINNRKYTDGGNIVIPVGYGLSIT